MPEILNQLKNYFLSCDVKFASIQIKNGRRQVVET